MLPQAFIVEEPKRLVTPAVHMGDHNGAADVSSELIANDMGHLNIHRVRAQARGGDHRIVAVIFISGKVQLVCAAARSQDNGGRLSEARVRPHGFNSKLLDSFNSRPHADDPSAETVELRDAVQIDIQGPDLHPIDSGAARTALYACGQAKKQSDIATVQGEVSDLAGLSHIADHAARRLNGCSNVLNLDNVFQTSDPQRRVYRHVLTDVQCQCPRPSLKAFLLHSQSVWTNRQSGEGVQALLDGHHLL